MKSMDKKNKNLLIVILLIIGGVQLFAGIIVVGVLFVSNAQIEDTNGSGNTDLAVITMDEILSNRESNSSFVSSFFRSGSNTRINGMYEAVDYTSCRYKSQKYSGTHTVHATKTTADTLVLDIEVMLESGNLEVVILIDGEYYDHVPVHGTQSITLQNVSNKTVTVKVAGESARFSISVTRDL